MQATSLCVGISFLDPHRYIIKYIPSMVCGLENLNDAREQTLARVIQFPLCNCQRILFIQMSRVFKLKERKPNAPNYTQASTMVRPSQGSCVHKATLRLSKFYAVCYTLIIKLQPLTDCINPFAFGEVICKSNRSRFGVLCGLFLYVCSPNQHEQALFIG